MILQANRENTAFLLNGMKSLFSTSEISSSASSGIDYTRLKSLDFSPKQLGQIAKLLRSDEGLHNMVKTMSDEDVKPFLLECIE